MSVWWCMRNAVIRISNVYWEFFSLNCFSLTASTGMAESWGERCGFRTWGLSWWWVAALRLWFSSFGWWSAGDSNVRAHEVARLFFSGVWCVRRVMCTELPPNCVRRYRNHVVDFNPAVFPMFHMTMVGSWSTRENCVEELWHHDLNICTFQNASSYYLGTVCTGANDNCKFRTLFGVCLCARARASAKHLECRTIKAMSSFLAFCDDVYYYRLVQIDPILFQIAAYTLIDYIQYNSERIVEQVFFFLSMYSQKFQSPNNPRTTMDETTVLSDGSRETKGMIVLAEASGMQVSANWLGVWT